MRVASLSPAVTEILFALGVNEQIMCTDQFSDYPEEALLIAHVKDHQNVCIEDVQEFDPELVLTSTIIQKQLSEKLHSLGFSVIHQDPRTVNAIFESIRHLGAVFAVEKESKDLILHMQQGLNDVKRKSGKLPRRSKIYIEEWHVPPMASGNWVPEIATIAGGEQFPIPVGSLSREVSLKEVEEFDPEMIIVSWCGAGSTATTKILEDREGWDGLRAVMEGNIRIIDDSLLNRPGPRLVEGAQRLYSWLFELLH